MQDELTSTLERLGLSPKEISVYLYGLSHPPQPVSLLGKALRLSRTNTYDVVKRLSEKGLCHNVGGEYGRKIVMTKPDEILKLINHKEREYSILGTQFKKILPELRSHEFSGITNHPRITYYEGTEGMRKLFATTLQASDKKIFTVLSLKSLIRVLGREWLISYSYDRLERGIQGYTMRPDGYNEEHELFADNKKGMREVRYLPPYIKTDAAIVLFDNKVCFITMNEQPFGTLIESNDFSATMRSWFNGLWEVSSETFTPEKPRVARKK